MVAAMGKTGGGSIASGLLSALATKIVATMLGPGSIALLQTLQQLRDGAVTVATANGRTALVQGASALEGVERREYLRTVALLFTCGTLLVATAMLMAPTAIAHWSKLPARERAFASMARATVALLSVFVFLTAILNALREIGKLALVQVASPLVAAADRLAIGGTQFEPDTRCALVFFLVIPAAATVLAAAIALRGHRLHEWIQGSGRWWSGAGGPQFSFNLRSHARERTGRDCRASGRAWIDHPSEGLAMTGQFDAAWNISMNQVTLILGSVQAYYLPTLAAAKSYRRTGQADPRDAHSRRARGRAGDCRSRSVKAAR